MDATPTKTLAFSPIPEIIEDIRQGKMVIIVDDEDRENEGDLLMAAARVRPEDINFMARYGRGLICLTLTRERCEQLRLPLMVSGTHAKHLTNFTLSIEAATGVTTGISAADRARTVQAAVAPGAKPEDLVQPGHIFPLMAQAGGVLTRAGHTEAGCDLARLAGLAPASVIVEILNEDGSMARRPELEKFALQHGLKMGTIADLIHYRLQHEKTIEYLGDCTVPTEFGRLRLVTYRDIVEDNIHFALIKGKIDPQQPVLVRVHVLDTLRDVLNVGNGEPGWLLRDALKHIGAADAGVAVILRQAEQPKMLLERLREFQMEEQGVRKPKPAVGADFRTIGLGAQILSDLGVVKMRVLGAPRRLHGLSGFGLEVVEYVGAE